MNRTIFKIWVLLILGTSLFTAAVVSAPSETAFDSNLMMSQNSYSDNWTGGETGSISWVFNANYLRKQYLTPKWHNKSTIKLSYGQTHNQDTETKNWYSPVKSTDLIELETVFRMTLGMFVDPFISGRLQTQFLDGSDPLKERIFNPVIFTESFGTAKVLIETEKHNLSARLGFGLRQTLNRDVLDESSTSGYRNNQTTNDGGFEFVSEFKSSFTENLTYQNKLILFKALFNSNTSDLTGLPNEDYWKEVDINWEHILSANITRFFAVNLYLQVLFDKEIDLGGRLKQTLSMGLTYKFHR